MAEKPLEEKVIEDLIKTGFGSEMRTLNTFLKRKWDATGTSSYMDLDEGKTRESDIKAHITKYEKIEKNIIAQCYFQIVAEVKRTNKPWVIFKEIPYWQWRLGEKWNSLVFYSGFKPKKSMTEALSKYSLSEQMGWFGNGIHEAFKKPDQPSRWYSALVSVCKAGENSLKANSWDKNKIPSDREYPYIFFVKPVIVIDGILMSCFLDKDAGIHVDKITAASIHFEFLTKNYSRGSYLADIVTIDYLSDYLEICEKRNNNIFNALKKFSLKSA